MDIFTPEMRSKIMRGVKSKDTKPELVVRRLLHGLGYRFRVHRKGLPGKPDIAFIGRKKAIFVHGCFWHQHLSDACKIARRPTSNTEFWDAKLNRNMERDAQAQHDLETMGWQVLTIWECEVADLDGLQSRLANFLGPRRHKPG